MIFRKASLKKPSDVEEITPPVAIKTPMAELFILSGYHSGNTISLDDGGEVRIGSADDDDVILSDPGLVASHVTITLGHRPGRIEIEATTGPVELDDGRLLTVGEVVSVALPSRVALVTESGPRVEVLVDSSRVARDNRGRRTRARVVAAIPKSSRRAKPRMPLVFGGVGLLVLVIALTVSRDQSRAAISDDARLEAITKPASVLPEKVVVPAPTEPAPTVAGAADALRAKLSEAGIGMLTVTSTTDFVAVSGALPPRHEKAWQTVRRWYDREHASAFTLVSEVILGSERSALPTRPAGVWLGDQPYLVDTTGQQRGVGAHTADGWEILAIDRDGVRLRKDDQELTLSLQ